MNITCKICSKPKLPDDPKWLGKRCRACYSLYNKALRDRPNSPHKKRRFTSEFREEHKLKMREYRKNNPDYVDRGRQYHKEYARIHHDKRLAYQLARQKANKEFVNTFKTKPCHDCGGTFPPYVMDFDHVHGKKLGNVSSMCNNRPQHTIQKEIEKCELVCANCHRIRTQSRYDNSHFSTIT